MKEYTFKSTDGMIEAIQFLEYMDVEHTVNIPDKIISTEKAGSNVHETIHGMARK